MRKTRPLPPELRRLFTPIRHLLETGPVPPPMTFEELVDQDLDLDDEARARLLAEHRKETAAKASRGEDQ